MCGRARRGEGHPKSPLLQGHQLGGAGGQENQAAVQTENCEFMPFYFNLKQILGRDQKKNSRDFVATRIQKKVTRSLEISVGWLVFFTMAHLHKLSTIGKTLRAG